MAELENWRFSLDSCPRRGNSWAEAAERCDDYVDSPVWNRLLRTLLLHVGCGWSLRETAVQAKLAGLAEISDVTLLNRLRDAEVWLRQLCELLLREQGVELESKIAGRSVRLLDATVVSEPSPTGSQWRIHYSLRLPTLECDRFVLTSARGAGTAERFANFHFHAPGVSAGRCRLQPSVGHSDHPGVRLELLLYQQASAVLHLTGPLLLAQV